MSATIRELHRACERGDVQALDRLIADGLTLADARSIGNCALRGACENGHLAVVERLLSLGLTADDVRARDNYALRFACARGHLAVVERLISLGLTLDDARANDNYALRKACEHNHLAVVERLLSLGLTAEDARALDNWALRYACANGHAPVVCVLAASGLIEPTGELHARALMQIIRDPVERTEQVDEDEVTRRAETRMAAARAAATWPGHADALAQLGPGIEAAWEALYEEATLTGYGALRFVD